MNKRIAKKYLSAEEQTVIELFRSCDEVNFLRLNDTVKEATKFVSTLGHPSFGENNGSHWLENRTRKIKVAAFLKGGRWHE